MIFLTLLDRHRQRLRVADEQLLRGCFEDKEMVNISVVSNPTQSSDNIEEVSSRVSR